MPSLTLSQSTQYKLSIVMVIVVAVLGVCGIVFTSLSKPQNKTEVMGISGSYTSSSPESILSSSAVSSESSISSASSSSAEFVETQPVSVVLNQTYANPSYPDLLLRYPASWKFSTTTTRSNYEGFANRTLLLEKENSVLTINLILATPDACNPTGSVQQQKAFANNLSRYTHSSNIANQANINFYYGVTNKFFAPCSYIENRLNSTIQSETFTSLMGKKQVYAQVEISLKSTNNQLIAEADSIIEALKTSVTQ